MKIKTLLPLFIVHDQHFKEYFRFSTVWHNHLRNKHLTEHLRNNSNELATVRFSAFCGAMLSNNSFLMQR